MAFNYIALQKRAAKLIAKYGMPAALMRNGVTRPCTVVETEYSPEEARGKLENPNDRVFLVAVPDLSIPPDREKDALIIYKAPDYTVIDQTLKIRTPVGHLAPANIPAYYELQVYR